MKMTGALVNTALYEHYPEVVEAFAARGDELIAHGHTNAQRQSDLLREAGLRYTLNWCHDEQPTHMRTRTGPHGLVMGIALHPYIVGQPYRLRHLRRALRHIVSHAMTATPGEVWLTSPGAIADAMEAGAGGA